MAVMVLYFTNAHRFSGVNVIKMNGFTTQGAWIPVSHSMGTKVSTSQSPTPVKTTTPPRKKARLTLHSIEGSHTKVSSKSKASDSKVIPLTSQSPTPVKTTTTPRKKARLTLHSIEGSHTKVSSESKASDSKVIPLTPANSLHGSVSASTKTTTPQPPVNISIFLESFSVIDDIPEIRHSFTQFEASYPKACPLPDGGICTIQHSNSNADVVFRLVRAVSNHPLRYWPGQLLAVLNLEANRGAFGIYTGGFRQLAKADIRIDHHPTSDAVYAEMCRYLPIDVWEKLPPPDPKKRKGIAMFSSDCKTRWAGFPERTKYYMELMKYVHIDQHGKCWHNVDFVPKKGDDWKEIFLEIASKYRMIVAFENIVQKDYITEKLSLIYKAGAIPVYRGAPEAYQWVPGNHTFIDASKYSPKELAEYMKRVNEDDQLFEYHTTKFDFKQVRETRNRVCAKADYMCMTCKLAHEIKMRRISAQSSKNN